MSYRFDAIKAHQFIFLGIDKVILKSILTNSLSNCDKKKNQLGLLTVPDFKVGSEVIVVMTSLILV